MQHHVALAEVSLQKTLEACAVACLVASHLVNGVVDRIEIERLCALCEILLTCASAGLSLYTHLKVLLGAVGENLAQELCELRGMVSLFERVLGERC